MDPTSGRMLLAIVGAAALSGLFILGSLLVAHLGGDDVEVAGAFVLAMFGLLLAMTVMIGVVRYTHGDVPEARPAVRSGMAALGVAGLVLTGWLVWQIGWPHSAAAVITLVPVAVMARDAVSA